MADNGDEPNMLIYSMWKTNKYAIYNIIYVNIIEGILCDLRP